MSKVIQIRSKIVFNKKIGYEYYKMRIHSPQIARSAYPGQFVHLICGNATNALLRRPFSFHRIDQDTFEVLYRIIGVGTKLLAKRKKNDTIDILGPLGNGFNVNGSKKKKPKAILVAGGMGVAPLFALAECLRGKQDVLALIGARNKKELICCDEFKRLGAEVKIATDDGSCGHRGFVTELLEKRLLSRVNLESLAIYTCGPKPMLRELARLSRNFGVVSYGSLEENMACGVGACLGCAVDTTSGYRRVCKDGPVFNLWEIIWPKRNL